MFEPNILEDVKGLFVNDQNGLIIFPRREAVMEEKAKKKVIPKKEKRTEL